MTIDRWRGKVAMVTGASGGIGLETARQLARAGMKVAVCARRRDRLEELAAELGDECMAITTDLRDEADILRLFAEVRRRWGGVDVLVNNAGLGHGASLMAGATEQWRDMLDVNVLALTICTREAVADMRSRGDDGHVVHVSSMSAHRVAGSGGGFYSGTKFMVRALTEALRLELRAAGSAIRVTAISPGFVETGFAEVYSGSAERAAETYGRFPCLQPDDVARAVLYALSQPAHVQLHDVLMRPTQQDT